MVCEPDGATVGTALKCSEYDIWAQVPGSDTCSSGLFLMLTEHNIGSLGPCPLHASSGKRGTVGPESGWPPADAVLFPSLSELFSR